MTSFTLTAATDNVSGGLGRDVITGTTATWQTADTIDGGGGGDILQISVLNAAAATVTDAMLVHLKNMETLALSGTFAETVTLGANSDAAGITELNGYALTGNLTVDASGRMNGITIDTSKGAETLTGTIADDTFNFTSGGLTSADKVNGGGFGDTDTIDITDKAAVTDAAFAHVTNVERLALGGGVSVSDYTGQKVTLGSMSIAAGIREVDVLDGQGATVDASARTVGIVFHGGNGDDVLKASQGNDQFFGGDGSDSFQAKETQFNQADKIDGGAGRDEIRLLDATTAIIDQDFAQVHSIETLVFAATGKETLSLDAKAAAAGLDTIDASKETAGITITLGAGMTNDLTIDLGTGADKLTLGTGSEHTVVMKSTALNNLDTITGSGNDTLAFTDAVKLTDKSFLNFGGATGFVYLELESAAKAQTFTAGADFQAFVQKDGLQEIIATGAAKDASITFDFSQYSGKALAVNGSGGGDVFIAGTVNHTFFGTSADADQGVGDSFRYHSADYTNQDTIFGGKSNADELVFLDDSTVIQDADFAATHGIETIRLSTAATGFYGLALGTQADNAGIELIDASKAGVLVAVNAGSMSNDVTFIAGAKDNSFLGGAGDDTVVIDPKTLSSGDFLDGSTSTHGDTLKFSAAGAITAAQLVNVHNFEFIQLSDKGNSLVLSDVVPTTAQTVAATAFDGDQLQKATYILTGAGKDTVDLSQLTTGMGQVAIIGSAGGDKYIGSKGDDTFVFQKSSDLTAATVIDGGNGGDGLVLAGGTYTAAQFKGISNIEGITLSDADTAANFSVTLDNAMFTHSASHLIIIGPTDAMTGNTVIDASAVTDATAELYVDAGTGNDVYKGTAGNDYFVFDIDNTGHASLNAQDVVAGGAGHDELQIGGATFAGTVTLSDSDISHVSGIELLYLRGAQGLHWNLTLDQAFQAEGVSEVDFSSSADTLHFDATAYTEDLLVHAGDSDGVFLLGAGNDTIEFEKGSFADAQLTGTTTVNGGGGHNSLLFVGAATVTDADFAQVSKVQEIDVQTSKISLTLGTNSDAAGIATVDATHAGAAATIDGTASHQNLTLHGSALADILEGGSGTDLIAGGGGGDILIGGAGNNVFYYASAADSHQEAGNNLSLADIIGDFHAGDTINIDSLVGDISGVTNQGTVANFPTNDVAGFYGNNQVAVEFDGANTRVFVDANHDGNFNLNQDVVIQVIGNHVAALADTASYN